MKIAASGGALVTEFAAGRAAACAIIFPQRNRLISGLVARRSGRGSGRTQRLADHGRPCPRSRPRGDGRARAAVAAHRRAGATELIRDGAALICDAGDVLFALGLEWCSADAGGPTRATISMRRATPEILGPDRAAKQVYARNDCPRPPGRTAATAATRRLRRARAARVCRRPSRRVYSAPSLVEGDGRHRWAWVAVLMGSESDWPVMQACTDVLDQPRHRVRGAGDVSAHRTPAQGTAAVRRGCRRAGRLGVRLRRRHGRAPRRARLRRIPCARSSACRSIADR